MPNILRSTFRLILPSPANNKTFWDLSGRLFVHISLVEQCFNVKRKKVKHHSATGSVARRRLGSHFDVSSTHTTGFILGNILIISFPTDWKRTLSTFIHLFSLCCSSLLFRYFHHFLPSSTFHIVYWAPSPIFLHVPSLDSNHYTLLSTVCCSAHSEQGVVGVGGGVWNVVTEVRRVPWQIMQAKCIKILNYILKFFWCCWWSKMKISALHKRHSYKSFI